MQIKQTYQSPRWSGEILDCSMPMTFDTYNKCSFNCLYCFSYYQKSHTHPDSENYQNTPPTCVNVSKIRQMFHHEPELTGTQRQFSPYIKQRLTMQWGGLADPFDEYERKHGIGLKVLRVLKSLDYPICFSTKAVWWLQDKRYTELFQGQKNWNCKFSIINLDAKVAAKMEIGCPTPQARLRAIHQYAALDAGGATLRLRPFIIGMSDVNDAHIRLIEKAGQAGATAMSTEFFCLEARANGFLRARYQAMSDVLGFDIYKYYQQHSHGASGYRRLNYELKAPYIEAMQKACRVAGMRFYVSDAHHKEKCANGNCCGLPADWKYSRGQFTEALMIARKKGRVRFSDIEPGLDMYDFPWVACGFNIQSATQKAFRYKQTMKQYIRQAWNSPNSGKSPYKYFGGVLKPIGLDDNRDVIYEFDYVKAGVDTTGKVTPHDTTQKPGA